MNGYHLLDLSLTWRLVLLNNNGEILTSDVWWYQSHGLGSLCKTEKKKKKWTGEGGEGIDVMDNKKKYDKIRENSATIMDVNGWTLARPEANSGGLREREMGRLEVHRTERGHWKCNQKRAPTCHNSISSSVLIVYSINHLRTAISFSDCLFSYRAHNWFDL